ncbi:MAG: S-layer homology domain-containing protein [Defluviitaleaceae bacterium]|nr:S-layer homology domain-containing protein [Defluviitaleaceae bacterium]
MRKIGRGSRMLAVLLAFVITLGLAVSPAAAVSYEHPAADKGELGAVFAEAQIRIQGDYTPESRRTLEQAIPNARHVLENSPDATQAQADAATAGLLTALDALEQSARLSTYDLGALIGQAREPDGDLFTPLSYALMLDALEDAARVYADPEAIQGEIDAAANALQEALEGLTERADKAALRAAIRDAESLGADGGSREGLERTLATARRVANSPNAAQTRVDAVAAALQAAVSAPPVRGEVLPLSGNEITVYISFDAFTIGRGFFAEPVRMSVPEGSTVTAPSLYLLESEGIEFNWEGSEWGGRLVYLRDRSVYDGTVDVPEVILQGIMRDHYDPLQWLEWLGTGRPDGALGEGGYTSFAGWSLAVNHVLSGVGSDAHVLEDGDVVRWSFSLSGGSDLGAEGSWDEPYFIQEDKSEIIRALFMPGASPAAVRFALSVILDPFATPAAVAHAMAALRGEQAPPSGWEAAKHRTLDRLVSAVPAPAVAQVGGEWAVLALARAGFGVPAGYFEGYLGRVGAYLAALPEHTDPNHTAPGWVLNPETGRREVRLAHHQSTENARLVLALSALGRDASSFTHDGATYDLVAQMGNRLDATSSQMWGAGQGPNGPLWNLAALFSRGWNTPYHVTDRIWVGGTTAANPVTTGERIEWLLNAERATGGWSLSGAGDPAITGMALQALAPHRSRADVGAAVDRSLIWLASEQTPSGGWESGGVYDVQSVAQVIVALTALGIDPQTDARFATPGGNPLTSLLSFQDEATGGFRHAGFLDQMATEQAALALVAYYRFSNAMPHLLNMGDAFGSAPPPPPADLTLAPSAVSISDTNLRATVNVGGTAAGAITTSVTPALPHGVGLSVSGDTIIFTGARPAAGHSAIIGAYTVTVTRQGISRPLSLSVSLTPEVATTPAPTPTISLSSSAVSINDTSLSASVSAGGTAVGTIGTSVSPALPQGVTLTTSGGTVNITGRRPAAGQSPISSTHTVTVTRQGVSTTFTLNVHLTPSGRRVHLSVTNPGGSAGHAASFFAGYIYLHDNETAYSILRRSEAGLTIVSRGGGAYVASINGLSEFDDGPLSGWRYSINGTFPDVSASLYNLRDGYRVAWVFTADGEVDRTALLHEIGRAQGRLEASYTAPTWAVVQTTLAEAVRVRDNPASQAEVDAAAVALRNAINALVVRPGAASADRTALNAEIDQAEDLAQSDYTAASWAVLQAALDEATRLRDDPRATQADVDAAATNLAAARNALVPQQAVQTQITARITGRVAVADVQSALVRDLAAQAMSAGTNSVTISVDHDGYAGRVEIGLYAAAIRYIIQSGASLTVQSGVASITFDLETLMGLIDGVDEDTEVRIVADMLEGAELGEAQRETVGDAPVIRLQVIVGGNTVRDFDGTATVTLPLGHADGTPPEDRDLLAVYHLGNDGGTREMPGAVYSRSAITFVTNHFSLFFVREWISPFEDVARGAWYLRSVRFVHTRGLMSGTAAGQFSPEGSLSRAMIVAILWRNEGEPDAESMSEFLDVRPGYWYSDAVAWAGASGIVSGVGGGLFDPNGSVTREQLAVILRNYAASAGRDTAAISFTAEFTDEQDVSPWARDAMMWATANNLISGRTETTLAPGSNATRAEAASILRQLLEDNAER